MINDIENVNKYILDSETISALLKDNTTGKNIIWATNNYKEVGPGYAAQDQITLVAIADKNLNLIKPRIEKSKKDKSKRTKDKGEVFTPSWVCNKQNNLIDNVWFGRENVFNFEEGKCWQTNCEKIKFPKNKTWQDYVQENRLEITCGEAPYLVSRYDTVTGNLIPIKERIGLLDRKFRIISENIHQDQEWVEWAKKAIKSIYGYDWQGDNVLLARLNLLFTFQDYYSDKFGVAPIAKYVREIAEIISWNIWQMDGLKFVVPNSCCDEEKIKYTLFGEEKSVNACYGCKKDDIFKHNGIYCLVMNWKTGKKEKFVDQIGKNKRKEK